MRLLNNPKSIVGRICWSWHGRRRRIVRVVCELMGEYIVHTVSDDGCPNCANYGSYFWDEELTRPLTLQDVQ